MAAVVVAPSMPIPPHLHLTSTPHSGRSLTCLSRQPAGSLVLSDEPFCHVVHQRFRTHTCDSCYGFSSIDGDDLPVSCVCGAHYCSADCQKKQELRHAKVCRLTNLGSKKGSDKNLKTGINLLLSAISNDLPISYTYNQIAEDQHSVSTPGKAKRIGIYNSSEASLRKMVHCPLPPSSYSRVLSTVHFNAVGLYDEYGSETGYLVSPMMAMVNHSCVPNCSQTVRDGVIELRALRDIEVGEDISFSYVTLGQDDDRKKSIQENWGFTCRCARCEVESSGKCIGEALQLFDDKHVCYCGSVNVEVDRREGECVCHAAGL